MRAKIADVPRRSMHCSDRQSDRGRSKRQLWLPRSRGELSLHLEILEKLKGMETGAQDVFWMVYGFGHRFSDFVGIATSCHFDRAFRHLPAI